jgi:Ca2+:H+ antiporter
MAFLYFQIKTHAHLFEDQHSACTDEEDEDAAGVPILSFHVAVITMACFIALIVLMSNAMMNSLVNVAHIWGISDIFVAVITLPIVANASEHSAAIEAALQGRINVSIGVAVGSSVQIACGVFPFLVILGSFIGQPLSFTFQTYEAFIVLIIVMIVNAVVQDGESSWLEVRF